MNGTEFIENLISKDQALFHLINSEWTAPWLDTFMPIFTDLHKFPLFVIPATIVILIMCLKFRKIAVHVLFLCIISFSISDSLSHRVLKPAFHRSRPEFSVQPVRLLSKSHKGLSFPSNHAANMFGLATVLTYFFRRKWPLFFGIAALIAYSRIYVGVHFPLDVLGGALLGAITSLALVILYAKIKYVNPIVPINSRQSFQKSKGQI